MWRKSKTSVEAKCEFCNVTFKRTKVDFRDTSAVEILEDAHWHVNGQESYCPQCVVRIAE